MLTNHHCGYGTIQANSTTEHDYLTDGFWAMKKADEIPADFGVWFLDKITDVTESVLEGVNDEMSETDRSKKIRENIGALTKKAKEGKSEETFSVKVKPFYYGNYYYMFTYNIFNDVRLVGAPPSSIGKYGGDTDNWMWLGILVISPLECMLTTITSLHLTMRAISYTLKTCIARFYSWKEGDAMIMGYLKTDVI